MVPSIFAFLQQTEISLSHARLLFYFSVKGGGERAAQQSSVLRESQLCFTDEKSRVRLRFSSLILDRQLFVVQPPP